MKKTGKGFRQTALELLFLGLISLTPLLWFLSGEMLLGHDSGFRIDPVWHLRNLFYAWNPYINFGADWSFFHGYTLIQLPEAVFFLLTGSLRISQQITLVFWFFVTGIGMYVLARAMFPHPSRWFLRLFATVFYMFNFYILQAWFIAERAKFSLYAALPLGLLILISVFRRRISILRGAILFSLLFALINGGGNPSLFGGVIVVYSVAFIYFTVRDAVRYGMLKTLRFSGGVVLFFSVCFLLANAYWLSSQYYLVTNKFASAQANVGGISGILDWENMITANSSILNILRGQGLPDWYNNPIHTYANRYLQHPLLVLYSFLPIFVLVIGAFTIYWKKPKNTEDRSLLTLTYAVLFVGVVFAGGTHPPFGFIYKLFMTYVPGFVIFRSSYFKFVPAVYLSAGILVAYFLQRVIELIPRAPWRVWAAGAIVIVHIVYHAPYFEGKFFAFNHPFSTKVALPAYVMQTTDYINKHTPDDSKILLLPRLDPVFSSDSYIWGFWSLDPLLTLGAHRTVVYNAQQNRMVSELYTAIETRKEIAFTQLGRNLGVTHVLWRDDVMYNDKEITSDVLKHVKESLDSFTNVEKVAAFDAWILYQIRYDSISPVLSSVDQIVLASNNLWQDVIESYAEDLEHSVVLDVGTQEVERIGVPIKTIKITGACDFCDESSVNAFARDLRDPNVRYMPWSIFYPLIQTKEQRELQKAATEDARVDVLLSHSSRRISEIRQIALRYFHESGNRFISERIDLYRKTMSEVNESVSKLPAEKQSMYRIRVLGYLAFHKDQVRFLDSIPELVTSIDDLHRYIDDTIDTLRSDDVTTKSNFQKYLRVTIPLTAEYQITTPGSEPFSTIKMGDQVSHDGDTVFLEKGTYPVVLSFDKDASGAILYENADVTEVTVGQDSPLVIPIGPVRHEDKYYIYFRYRQTRDENVYFQIIETQREGTGESDREQKPFILQFHDNDRWQTVQHAYRPGPNAESARIEFFTPRISSDALVEDLSISEYLEPTVIFTSTKEENMLQMASLRGEYIDPTLVTLNVTEASSSFFLHATMAYDPGWKVYPARDDYADMHPVFQTMYGVFGEFVPEENHYRTNGFANGWYISSPGDRYNIVYLPQAYFYWGLAVSLGYVVVVSVGHVVRRIGSLL